MQKTNKRIFWLAPQPLGDSIRDIFGMVSSRDPKSMANRDLQRVGIKRSQIESLQPVVDVFFRKKYPGHL